MDHSRIDPAALPARSHLTTRFYAAAALAWVFTMAVARLLYSWSQQLEFDDSFMFYRYARNITHGLGMAWNPDGVPVYGMTSQLWTYLIVPSTWLPFTGERLLELGSWLTGMVALLILAFVVRRFSASSLLQRPAIVFALVALPLLVNPFFARHLTTGMDTMLSFLTNTLLAWAVLRYLRSPSEWSATFVGGLSFLTVFARPDNIIVALGVPTAAWLLAAGDRRWRDLPGLIALPVILLGGEILLCDWYFTVPLPLSFYVKSANSYAGFQNPENSSRYLYEAGLCALPFVAILIATMRRERWRPLLILIAPVIATGIYFLTVRQIMGWWGRYYIPFLPFIAIPSLLCLDDAIRYRTAWTRNTVLRAALTFVLYAGLYPVALIGERAYHETHVPRPIKAPELATVAHDTLPQLTWSAGIRDFGDLLGELPAGTVIAATEVGYLSYEAPRANIIDLAGLNDTHIALYGMSVDYILQRQPDLIWLPQLDYTGMRAQLLSDPRLFDRYIVVKGALNYGLAVRRDGPRAAIIAQRLGRLWAKLYPGRNMADYMIIRSSATIPR